MKLFILIIAVPSAPANIKAVVSSRNKILVSWLPPSSPNGVLVGYTLYMSVIEDGREVCNTFIANHMNVLYSFHFSIFFTVSS